MTDREVRDELMTLLVAGHETTATALAWAFERVLRHPEVLARLDSTLAADDTSYLEAVVRETLRLRPILPNVGRMVASEWTLGEWTLPPGVGVLPSIALLHRREDVYPEPEAFRPERFLGRRPDGYSWIPFGGGTRRCLGASFAEYEMRTVIRTVLAACDLVPATSGAEGLGRQGITLVPQSGARVLQRRAPVVPARARRVLAAA
jgi:cytochrome P450